jgi:Tol biopolymer transport system component
VNARRLAVLVFLITALVPASSALASFPGAVGRIVFTSDREGSSTSDIYSAAADGSDVQRLTFTVGFEQDPAWSPDGSRIAYEADYQNHFRLFVMNQDGSGQHLISPEAGSTVEEVQPAWSPDGAQIAFASTRGGGAWHIWLMNADGTNLRELPGVISQHPAWSPDGLRIAGDAGGSGIYVIGADGTNERRLTTPPASHNDESPDWSPDGTTIAFSESAWDGTSSALDTVGADGTGERQLTTGAFADYDPSWSPDGTRLVFRRRTTPAGFYQLYTIGAGGGNPSQLLTSARNDMGPSWGSSTSSPQPVGAPQVQIYSPEGRFYLPGTTVPAFYTCTSSVSYIVSCEGSQPLFALLDTSSAGLHRFSVTATDAEGRQTTATVTYTVLDFTAPTITLRTPLSGATYDMGDRQTVDFTCDDGAGGSGVQACSGTQPNGSPLDTSHAGSFTFQVIALDGANNFASAQATYRVVDRTPPSITITTPTDAATYGLGDTVRVNYTCSDGGSGIQSCAGSRPNGSQLDTGHLGSTTFQVTATDTAGNTSSAETTYRIVDRTPPTIAITTPANGATYTQDTPLTVDYTCADQPGGSGLASCTGDLASGALIDTSIIGSRTFTVTATDGAQNTATASSAYTVIFGFSGFFAPIAAFPTGNPFKAGEGIPLKFSLHGYRGSDLFVGTPIWTPCDSTVAGSTAATGTLSYNQSLDRYTFLATTNKAWAGTCSDLTLTFRDGTRHQARVSFGK